MQNLSLVPTPDTIPAPSWIFLTLDVITLIIHLLFINIVVGGTLIILFSRLKDDSQPLQNRLHQTIAGKVPTTFALAINFGVAPLLFIQVIYGHLFYSSSVLMAVFWILIIPLLIIAYYGAYIHIRRYDSALLSKTALAFTVIILLYVAFIFVNNMTLMVQPEHWSAYFSHRAGNYLNLSEPTLAPRYLHFLTASVAVAGMFMALLWYLKLRKGEKGADVKMKKSLQIFAIATSVQIIVGFWFLLAIPKEFMLQFMGQNMLYTIILMIGILLAIGAIITGFLGKFIPAFAHLLVTIIIMVITRMNLRSMYLDRFFNTDSLVLKPQYSILALFLLVFVTGLVIVAYMIKLAVTANQRRAD